MYVIDKKNVTKHANIGLEVSNNMFYSHRLIQH